MNFLRPTFPIFLYRFPGYLFILRFFFFFLKVESEWFEGGVVRVKLLYVINELYWTFCSVGKKKNKTNKNKRDLNPDKYLQSKLMMWEIKINWMTKTFLFHLIYYILFIPLENFKYEMKNETSKINSRIYNWIKLATLCDYVYYA